MPVHSPYFSEHGAVRHREAGGQQPGARAAKAGEVLRHHPAPVHAQRDGRAQADAAAAQHNRITRRVRPLNHPAHTNTV